MHHQHPTDQWLRYRKRLHSNNDAGRQWTNYPVSICGLDQFRQPGAGSDLQRGRYRAIDSTHLHRGCRQAMHNQHPTDQWLRYRKRLHGNDDPGREWTNNPVSICRLDQFRQPRGGINLQRGGCRAIGRPILHSGCRQAMHCNRVTAQRLR